VSAQPPGKKTAGQIEKKEEWILIFEKQLDRINRIERPSAEGISPQANKIPSIL
jgi:hypothetical protein